MNKILRAMVAALGSPKQALSKPRVGVFSVVNGKRGSLKKLGTRAANTKCAGECTCRCS